MSRYRRDLNDLPRTRNVQPSDIRCGYKTAPAVPWEPVRPALPPQDRYAIGIEAASSRCGWRHNDPVYGEMQQ